jgi:protein SDA1
VPPSLSHRRLFTHILPPSFLPTQANIKRDSQGYADEFNLQLRHYNALLDLFQLSPSQDSKQLADLVYFLAQVSSCYPDKTANLPTEIISLLDTHALILDPSLRISLVKALILLRNKNRLQAIDLLPHLFQLFKVPDKILRELVFRHIISDIKGANKKAKNERFNRSIQNFMYNVIDDEHEGTAKRGLSVLIEMWRRGIWRDTRTANVIASATYNKSCRIMLGAVKFFLGQDAEEDNDSDDEGDDGGRNKDGDDNNTRDKTTVTGPSKEDVYAAYHKGTNSSKKKKQKKIARVLQSVKKAGRRQGGTSTEGFAALQLLNDPQGFAEKLFSRLQKGGERFETRLLLMSLVSRSIGVHKLLVLNFYPFLQRYISPSQQEVTSVLACLVQACHDLIPPDTLAPVLRQLVDQFVHDRARPEVMTIGLKTVREICTRTPLVMNPELLQDLTEYKKFRNKEVSSAARGLIGLFRELAPGMLLKKDRGRGADKNAAIPQYGAQNVMDRVEGAEMLQQAIAAGKIDSDGELILSDDDDDDDDDGGLGEEDIEEEGSDDGDGEDVDGSDLEFESDDDGEEEEEEDDKDADIDNEEVIGIKLEEQGEPKEAAKPDSIASLKRKLAAVKANEEAAAEAAIPMEWGRMLTSEDFERIRELKHKKLVDEAMAKHGLKSASKRARALEVAEEEAEEMMVFREKLGTASQRKVQPSALVGKHKYRKDKEERMVSVLEGREGREFGAKSSLKKSKTGGLSNREKEKRKNLPLAARSGQVKKRLAIRKNKSNKNFKGHVRG